MSIHKNCKGYIILFLEEMEDRHFRIHFYSTIVEILDGNAISCTKSFYYKKNKKKKYS
jgi:hypothetical protein